MENNRKNKAVSEVVGTALLLSMAIALFVIVQLLAFAYPFNPSAPAAEIVGTIDQGDIVLIHNRGESISLKAKIIIDSEGETPVPIVAKDHLDLDADDDDKRLPTH